MNKRIITGALLALFSFAEAFAYDLPKPNFTLKLYPEGQGVDKGIVENGKAITLGPLESNGLTGDNVVNPTSGNISNIGDGAFIDIYIPKNCNGQMIVVCPGGGYSNVSAANEGSRVADWCLKHDIATCVVLYRMPNHHSRVPLTDVQNAFRYCRAHAAEWGVNQIGVMGFSAGGHLAATASNMFTDDVTRPDFSILVYPVITFEEFVTHDGTRRLLLPERTMKFQVDAYSMENNVSKDTPETILFCCADDFAVLPENSIRYYRAMQANRVKGEIHIFTRGGHGWGFTTNDNAGRDGLGDAQRQNFYDTLERWLKQIKK